MRFAVRLAYATALTVGLAPAFFAKVSKAGLAGLHVTERLAHAKLPTTRPLWINAASVGELSVAVRLVRALREQHPELPIFLTHSAEAARAIAPQQLGVLAHALPLDYHGVMQRFFKRLHPRMCLLIEQELWPNLIAAATANEVPIAVVNGRLSARSARRHANWLRCHGAMFQSLDLVCASTHADARRFDLLGASTVICSGNIKFDATPAAAKIAAGERLRERLRQAHGNRPVLLLASTRPGPQGIAEEEHLLPALKGLFDTCTIVLVPRHPERFDEVAGMLTQHNVKYVRYSSLEKDSSAELPSFILGDTMGDMDSYYACCDLAFIGASLVNRGGQNLMEALTQGKPVVCGPYMHNFAQLTRRACSAGAALQQPNTTKVVTEISGLLNDQARREQMGVAGRELAESMRGATTKTVLALEPLLQRSGLVN